VPMLRQGLNPPRVLTIGEIDGTMTASHSAMENQMVIAPVLRSRPGRAGPVFSEARSDLPGRRLRPQATRNSPPMPRSGAAK
jgi:hypothetical protein